QLPSPRPPHLRSRPAAAPDRPAAHSGPAPPPARARPTSSSSASAAAAAAARLNRARRAAPHRLRARPWLPIGWAPTPPPTRRVPIGPRASEPRRAAPRCPSPLAGGAARPPALLDSCRARIEPGSCAGSGCATTEAATATMSVRGSGCAFPSCRWQGPKGLVPSLSLSGRVGGHPGSGRSAPGALRGPIEWTQGPGLACSPNKRDLEFVLFIQLGKMEKENKPSSPCRARG
ncbi:hypothetical protein MC885_019801, partial [Smutsia gigantea]